MKHVSIIIPGENTDLSSVINTYKILKKVNSILPDSSEYYTIDLVDSGNTTSLSDGVFSIRPSKQFNEIGNTDLIIIPSIQEAPLRPEATSELSDWIYREHKHNRTEVASLCRGVFLLAQSGLLHGKSCSTHWSVVDEFEESFPEIQLLPNKIITDNKGIYTSGGELNSFNLLIHLIEKYNGRTVALEVARYFGIDYGRESQAQFNTFNGSRNHDDKQVHQAQNLIEQDYGQKITLEELSGKLGLSKRNLIRRFKKATKINPGEYLQRVRIEAAKKMLEQPNNSIKEAMTSVGYSDNKAFREIFKRYTGISPAEYKSSYTRESIG